MDVREFQMVDSFKNLAKSIGAYFDNTLLDNINISCSELSILGLICESEKKNKKINITEISNKLKITKSAVSQSISKLEKKGFVKRKINLFDKKINYLSVTKETMKQSDKKHIEHEKMINNVINKMGEEDSKELSRLLNKLENIINELGKVESVC